MTESAHELGAAPLPQDVDPHRLRRAALRLGALLVIAVIVITLLPGLGGLRKQFAHANAGWIIAGCLLELLSALSYVIAFRLVFCSRMSWVNSYKIAMSELGADSLLPVGGIGGLALGAWALRRGGMDTEEIADKSVAFFLLTSAPNVATLVLIGLGLGIGVLPGSASIPLTVGPAAVAAGAIVLTLMLGPALRRTSHKLQSSNRATWLVRIAPALRSIADGVEEAVQLIRHGNALLWLGLVGYMLFDILVLWASFRAIGVQPELTIVWIAYLIGQLGNLIPIPGGIGGVELGLVGMLVLYGVSAVPATAAVLLYRAIELWIPAMFGLAAFIQLRVLLRREADSILGCRPGETIEIIGRGHVVAKPATASDGS